MQRLTGLDTGFLSMETPSSAMHVASVAIYDPTATPGWTIEAIRTMVGDRLHLAPPFRRRLVEVPLGIHHPVWIEDPDFDLDWHIRHIAVPAPGGSHELNELVSHLVAMPLDRSRPLWEMWVIEGLEHGHIATLAKVHHAAIDGASGAEILVALFDLSPEVSTVEPPEIPWTPDRVPSDAELVGFAVNSLIRQPVRVARASARTLSMAVNLRAANRRIETAPPPSPFSAPRTSINATLTPRRSYATASLSLSDAKRVKNEFGCTVNDVVLALCGGSLRRYFAARDETLDGPLVAMVPMSVRSEDEKGAMGNRVASMLTSLATDIDDPVERLLAIHDGMKGAKDQTNAIGADLLTDWAEFASPAVLGSAARLYSRMRMADRHRPIFNVTISNVPGPPFPLYSAGAKLLANFPIGPIFDGGALNMTVMSYQDSLDFGLLACPDLLGDVDSLVGGLQASLDELVDAVEDAVPVTQGRAKAAAASVMRTDIPAAPKRRPRKQASA